MLFDFAEKKDTFLTFKNGIFQSPRNRIVFMLSVKKCQLFGVFRFGQNKSRNNA